MNGCNQDMELFSSEIQLLEKEKIKITVHVSAISRNIVEHLNNVENKFLITSIHEIIDWVL